MPFFDTLGLQCCFLSVENSAKSKGKYDFNFVGQIILEIPSSLNDSKRRATMMIRGLEILRVVKEMKNGLEKI